MNKQTKNKLAIFFLVSAVFIFIFIIFSNFFLPFNKIQKPAEKKVVKKLKPIAPPPVYCPLSGNKTTNEQMDKRPLAIMIENHTKARPQSGLIYADMVFEVVAEGGITRFLAVYHSKEAETVGPIRSVRDYYAHLAKGVDGIIVHCGGSPGGYQAIKDLGVAEIDQFANSKPFWRISWRRAPHNLYGSTTKIRERAKELGLETPVDLSSWDGVFKDDAKLPKRGEVNKIELSFSSEKYNATYTYNPKTNSYFRYLGGEAHKDAEKNIQINPKNIVVLFTNINKGDSRGRMSVSTEGSGSGYVFRDGYAIKIQWSRTSPSSSFVLTDNDGNILKMNRGQTWYELLPSSDKVKFNLPKKVTNKN